MEKLNGIPILVVRSERKIQNRKHKKKRINKKYIKKYGFTIIHPIVKDGEVVTTPNEIVMNEKTYKNFKIILEDNNEQKRF